MVRAAGLAISGGTEEEAAMARSAQARKQAPEDDIADRVAALDWGGSATSSIRTAAPPPAHCSRRMNARHCPRAMTRSASIASRVIMGRHGFGRGEYKYFAYPLPDTVAALRASLYPPLRRVANRWNEADRARRALSRPSTPPISSAATRPGRSGRRRCCCNTAPATTIACIRTSTASMSSRCRSPFLLSRRATTSPAANSC